jgi:hypothetical protein
MGMIRRSLRTDSKGRQVNDLTAADFVLEEDGKPR